MSKILNVFKFCLFFTLSISSVFSKAGTHNTGSINSLGAQGNGKSTSGAHNQLQTKSQKAHTQNLDVTDLLTEESQTENHSHDEHDFIQAKAPILGISFQYKLNASQYFDIKQAYDSFSIKNNEDYLNEKYPNILDKEIDYNGRFLAAFRLGITRPVDDYLVILTSTHIIVIKNNSNDDAVSIPIRRQLNAETELLFKSIDESGYEYAAFYDSYNELTLLMRRSNGNNAPLYWYQP